MANRRMFSLDVVDTDVFLDLPISSQALYFHLGMRADDDGFVSSPKRITNMVGCNTDDLKLLVAKGFIIQFDSGIIVITHWKVNNYLRADRYRPTLHQTEKKSLIDSENGYSASTIGIPEVTKMDTQDSIDKISIDKGKIDKDNKALKPIENYFPNDEKLNQAFVDYVGMRKQIKKPMTAKAIELALKKLHDLAVMPFSNEMDCDLAIQILEQSTMNSWLGLFPIKEQKMQSAPQGGVDWSRV